MNTDPDTNSRKLEPSGVFLALDRHRRRQQGVPTLSVLLGGRDEAVAIWRECAKSKHWTPTMLEADSAHTKAAVPLR